MKNLKVIYNDVVMFDSEIQEFIWTDSPNGVKVEGRVNAKPASSSGSGPGGGLLDMLSKASRAKAAQAKAAQAMEKREEAETVEVETVESETVESETIKPELTDKES